MEASSSSALGTLRDAERLAESGGKSLKGYFRPGLYLESMEVLFM